MGIPGQWVLEERESILRGPEFVRTVDVPPATVPGAYRKAYSLQDLQRLIRATPERTCD